jgi:hypothetical protein
MLDLKFDSAPVKLLAYRALRPLEPRTKKIMHITRKRKKRNLAIPAAAAAIPPNPRTAAINAIIRKVMAQPNIVSTSSFSKESD